MDGDLQGSKGFTLGFLIHLEKSPVSHIAGSLSGTLGYVMSELEDGKKSNEVVKTAKSFGYTEPGPHLPGGRREYMGRGHPPGSGPCINCGIDSHWARDCEAGDWKNRCYRCGENGRAGRNCQNPKDHKRGRSYSRFPSPRRGKD